MRTTTARRLAAATASSLLALVCACTGIIGDRGGSTAHPDAGPPPRPTDQPLSLTRIDALGPVPLRRLAHAEFRASVRDALGVDPGAMVDTALPADPETPFDNDAEQQAQSVSALVPGLATLAESTAQALFADATNRARLVGCTPSGANDTACFRTYVSATAGKLFRRPLSSAEVDAFVTTFGPFSVEDNDFNVGAELALRAMLQDVEFVYRVEQGMAVAGTPGVVRLSAWELASRLAYLLWGTAPDAALAAQAASGRLDTSDGVRAAAESMMADPRAATQLGRFHAMWLGYERERRLPMALAPAMRAESDELVRRVVLQDRRPWMDLYTFNQTFVTDALATHYGLPSTGSMMPTWVTYNDTRRGILSHATFLAASSPNPGDTSPTQRGLSVRMRLLCQDIPRPDPALLRGIPCTSTAQCAMGSTCVIPMGATMGNCVVDIDHPPPGDACKEQRYSAHAVGGCATCHSQMDPIGFGLENYGTDGAHRDTDPGRPDCHIAGRGRLDPIGDFSGPGELGALIASSPRAESCAVTQLFRYAQGRHEATDDGGVLMGLVAQLHTDHGSLRDLLLELVSSDAFRHRVLPQ